MTKYLVLDIGGSSIKYAVMDKETNIYESSFICTPMSNLDDFVETIGSLYDQYKECISGIAISMPGILNPETGYCYTGGALQYIKNINIVNVLQKRCPCPITIGNDAKCASQAELEFGNLKGIDDAVVILLGTGIGGCLIKNGCVHYGKHFFGGEFSFINIDGKHSWHQVNGIKGLLQCVQESLNTTDVYNGHEIFEMAHQGNVKVQEGIKNFVRILVTQIYNLQAIFDPEKVVIGGGISAQKLLFDYIEEISQQYYEENDFFVKPWIEPCLHRNNSNLIGALYQFLYYR